MIYNSASAARDRASSVSGQKTKDVMYEGRYEEERDRESRAF
jgi:hypothetical protein